MPHVETEYKYEALHKYPHLRPADAAIWERFIEKNPKRFRRVWYDFRIGDHAHDGTTCENCMNTGWYDLTRWQIDVLGEDDAAIYVIEVKPSANAKALGQALSYALLFVREYQATKPVIPVVLTDHEISTTRVVADKLDVKLWVA
jgi:hypothetical protein